MCDFVQVCRRYVRYYRYKLPVLTVDEGFVNVIPNQLKFRIPLRPWSWMLTLAGLAVFADPTLGQETRFLPPLPAGNSQSESLLPGSAGNLTPESNSPYVAERIDPDHTLELQVGRPTILRLTQPPLRDQIGDPKTLELLNITETELSLTGLQVGTTVLNFWFGPPGRLGEQHVVSYLVRVLEDPEEVERFRILLARLEQEINRSFPNSVVQLSYVGRQVLVRGQARDIEEATSILRIVTMSLPRAEQAEQPFDPRQFFLPGVNGDDIIEAGGAEEFLQGQNSTGVNSTRLNQRVVNLLEIAGIHQVMLKVTVAEVNRNATRAIGADLRIGGSSGVDLFSLFPMATLGSPIGAGASLLVDRTDFDLALSALKTMKLARTLAEPNLVTLNGQPANFLVGGEFPIPEITGFTGSGLQGVAFVPYGVQLQFTPTVTDRNRIRLRMRSQVSTRSTDTVNVAGSDVPSNLNQRNFQTTVELQEGQTLAIAGLIQNSHTGGSSRVPFLGDIPYLGRLFSSDSGTYDEQELVVLVTPYLVNPVEGDTPLPLPGSDYFEPSDFEFFIKGQLQGCRSEDFRSAVRTDLPKMKAFRRLEQQYIIGQPGHSNGLLCPAP